MEQEEREIKQDTEAEMTQDNAPYGLCIEIIKYNVIHEKDGYFSWTPYRDKETFEKEKATLDARVIEEGVAPDYAKSYCRDKNIENGFV